MGAHPSLWGYMLGNTRDFFFITTVNRGAHVPVCREALSRFNALFFQAIISICFWFFE